jgi:hypothetical protein
MEIPEFNFQPLRGCFIAIESKKEERERERGRERKREGKRERGRYHEHRTVERCHCKRRDSRPSRVKAVNPLPMPDKLVI